MDGGLINEAKGILPRSYRSQEPLRIIGEVTDWVIQTTKERGEWHEKLAKTRAKLLTEHISIPF